MIKIHKDAIEIPTTLDDKKELVKWILNHPLWEHALKTIKIPPDDLVDDYYFKDNNKEDFDKSDWREETVTDGSYHSCVEFDYVYVNPLTDEVDDDVSLNTKFQIWVEAGGWSDQSLEDNDPGYAPDEGWNDYNKWIACDDWRLMTGADDMEAVLLKLAVLVKLFYNDDGTDKRYFDRCPQVRMNDSDEDDENFKDDCEYDADGFCTKCGFSKSY